MEWLNEGQNVQRYKLEAFVDGKWKEIFSGYALGHKKIDNFPEVTASKVRLNILSSAGTARIREFQLFRQEAIAKK